LLKNLAVYNTF